jgi:hypothetical protein
VSIRRKQGVGLVTLIMAGAVAMGAYAFTAGNTVPTDNNAGFTTGTTTPGYTVSDVDYTLNATDPSNIDAVVFNLDKDADTVYGRFVSTDKWYTCSVNHTAVAGKYGVSCDTTTGATFSDATTSAAALAAHDVDAMDIVAKIKSTT